VNRANKAATDDRAKTAKGGQNSKKKCQKQLGAGVKERMSVRVHLSRQMEQTPVTLAN
jgi:hypothetical protein